jgi:hypothetical protein
MTLRVVLLLVTAAVGALLALISSDGLAGGTNSSDHTNPDCETAAFQEYNAALFKLQGIKVTNGGDPTIDEKHLKVPFSIEETVAGRRLEEGFCLKVVACERRAGGTDMEDAVHFIGCIDNEDKEHVLSNLEDGTDAERREAISRLKDE